MLNALKLNAKTIETSLVYRVKEKIGIITEEDYIYFVKLNCFALRRIPIKYRTKEVCKAAVTTYGYSLQFVPDKFKTDEICKIALIRYPYALRFIPEKLRTEEICKIAVSKNKTVIAWVPKHLRNKMREYYENS